MSKLSELTFQFAKGDRLFTIPKPEYDCPKCLAVAGEWCIDLLGGQGWQHADRPVSSWEETQ